MGGYARGKHALAISDRSGMRFPYSEMVREWNGSLVHYSEFEAKQPQLDPKPVGSDPQALWNPRPQRSSTAVLILLDNNPFTSVIQLGVGAFVNVYSEDHQRKAGDIVRFRGFPEVLTAGTGGADAYNLQQFRQIPTVGGMDINSASGFTISLGQIDSAGNVTGATTNDSLTDPINYFYISLGLPTASMVDNIKGGGPGCSAGPVTLKAL